MAILASGPRHVAGTTPYPWPYDGDLAGQATAVLVVQPRGGSWPEQGEAAVGQAAREVAAAVRAAGGAVVSVTTAPPGSLPEGAVSRQLPSGDLDVRSEGIDGFYGSPLDALLRARGLHRLLLVGLGTETCVHSTMRSANDRGYECLLVRDACLAHHPELDPRSISMIEMSGGIFGAVGTAEAVVAALTPRSDT